MKKYNKDHCWQYEMRLETLKGDKNSFGFDDKYIEGLRVSDFTFKLEGKENFQEIKEFIIKYEWLGTLPPYPTHYFTARHRGLLAGVLIYTMPNAFSKLLGENTKDIERLLARGACSSWTPKNLASSFISWSIDYMVKNTQYRVFTAYSDPMAKELGTVYQACNWIYLGQSSGTTYRYREPNTTKWISDRKFRNVSSYKRYAREMGMEWRDEWSVKRSIKWGNMPKEIEETLKEEGRRRFRLCEKMSVPAKHKYVMVKGENKRETKELRQRLYKLNPKIKGLEYPKTRGEW